MCAAGLGGVRLGAGQWLLLLTTLAVGTVPFCAIGLALGYVVGPNSAPALVNLVHLPAALASGLWLPVDLLPRAMRALSPWLPQYHLGQLALTITGDARDPDPLRHVLALALWTVIGLAAAAWAYHRDEGNLYG
jgi:ABC-2 type transport system permease protein